MKKQNSQARRGLLSNKERTIKYHPGKNLNIYKRQNEEGKIQKTNLRRVSPPSFASLTQTVLGTIKFIIGSWRIMFEPQHFMDLHDNSSLGDPKSWLSGDDNSSSIHCRTQSSLSSASTFSMLRLEPRSSRNLILNF